MAEFNENVIADNGGSKNARSDRYIFNASFIAYFIMIILLALLRVIIYLGAFDWAGDDGIDFMFTFIAQVVILAGGSIVLITCFFKKGFKGTLDYLQVKKPKPYIFLAFIIGFFGYFTAIAVNFISVFIFSFFGWVPRAGAEVQYPFWMFFVMVFFTAVLPGICEELAHRGVVIRAAKTGGASDTKAILISGLLFGLFHMYIGQTVFTFALGCVMAFLTVKSKSIVPAIIMHFTNNFISICHSFGALDWAFATDEGLFLFIGFCFLSIVGLILMLVLFYKRARKAGDSPPMKPFVYQAIRNVVQYALHFLPQSQPAPMNQPFCPQNQSSYNPYPPPNPYAYQAPYNPYVQPAYNPYMPPVYSQPAYAPPAQSPSEPARFKPSFKDKIFYYAVIIFASLITIISFVSGL